MSICLFASTVFGLTLIQERRRGCLERPLFCVSVGYGDKDSLYEPYDTENCHKERIFEKVF